MMSRHLTSVAILVPILGVADSLSAQGPVPDYDFDWVTIGAVGNAPFLRANPGTDRIPVGSVSYAYRMSRLEITTSQWMEFMNTFLARADPPPFVGPSGPTFWGASPDPNYHGPGRRWVLSDLPDSAMFPVAGITWREAAMYCNWLNNNKGTDLSAVADGAYDISTFSTNPDRSFNDQQTHNPGARFWIPTLDEEIKAFYYDPDRYGPGEGGYWQYSNSSDVPPIPGPPGEGETNAGFSLPNFEELHIPLGAYPDVQSPWGLLDTSGATTEHMEWIFPSERPERRGAEGSWAGTLPGEAAVLDQIDSSVSFSPDLRFAFSGFRVASAVPAPTAGAIALIGSSILCLRRRRSRL